MIVTGERLVGAVIASGAVFRVWVWSVVEDDLPIEIAVFYTACCFGVLFLPQWAANAVVFIPGIAILAGVWQPGGIKADTAETVATFPVGGWILAAVVVAVLLTAPAYPGVLPLASIATASFLTLDGFRVLGWDAPGVAEVEQLNVWMEASPIFQTSNV